ncbi:MAG: hypothetical protein ACOX0F_08630 [Syntrophomonadaceae bacterium]|jgi:hypothetical protein
MSIKSVDMQVLVQKVGDVARMQHTQHNEANHRQGEFSQVMVNQTIANRQTVRELKEPDTKTVHERQAGEQEKERSRDQNRPAEKQSEPDQEIFRDFHKGSTIDIKI